VNKPPQNWKAWACHLRDKIPGDARVTRYADEREEFHLDIFTSRDGEGTVAATIGLMEYDQSRNPAVQVYTEILMDVRGQNEFIGNILSTIGFYIMKDGWKVAPGVVFEKMVEMFIPECKARHVIFLPPFQWQDGMTKVPLPSKTVYPLLAIPITEAEMGLVLRDGSEALTHLWETSNCDVLEWNREGVV